MSDDPARILCVYTWNDRTNFIELHHHESGTLVHAGSAGTSLKRRMTDVCQSCLVHFGHDSSAGRRGIQTVRTPIWSSAQMLLLLLLLSLVAELRQARSTRV
jgi:hypothetical protein